MTESQVLVNKILSGNTKAFEKLIEEHKQLVGHIVFRMIPNLQDREDICQDVFIKVFQNLAEFRFESKISTWMARITYNTCVNYLREKKEVAFSDLQNKDENQEIMIVENENYSPEKSAEEKDISVRLQEEIANLPLQYRTILTLYHLEDMSYAEIGKIMQWPEGTVKSYLFRARKLLKENLLSKYQVEDLWH